MSEPATLALLSTAAATGVLHTLIPDHWLPFVLIGRARGWSVSTVAFASGVAGVIHAVLSVSLGAVALSIGLAAVELAGHTLEGVGAALLVLFGLGYALWAWTKGGHFHPGGSLLHSGDPGGNCDGHEGPGHPEHLHYHADEGWIRPGRAGWGALGLAVIVGLNPCVLILPIMLAGLRLGPATLSLVAIAYTLPTLGLMVGLSVLGVKIGWPVRLPVAARHAEMSSGLLIALLGLVFWVLH